MDSAAAIATITPTPMQIAKEIATKVCYIQWLTRLDQCDIQCRPDNTTSDYYILEPTIIHFILQNVNHSILMAGGALAANASFTTSNIVALDSAIRNATSQSSIYTPVSNTSSSNTLPSNILTTPSNLNANHISNQSYQLVLTVPKATHPRIKYSGTKKPEDMSPLLVELPATATNLSTTAANVLEISVNGHLAWCTIFFAIWKKQLRSFPRIISHNWTIHNFTNSFCFFFFPFCFSFSIIICIA